jgi:arylsulfatase A-like enzyme
MRDWNTDRRGFLRGAAGAAVSAALPGVWGCREEALPVPPGTGPDLILIMADDLGYADLSIYGRRDYETPVLDGLARDGVMLTQAYSAAPVCSPTRVALMTGQYPARHAAGLQEPLTTHPTGLSPDLPTLPRLLKNAGYATALVGKWHLGLRPEYNPLRHGFDEFFGHLGPSVDYVSHINTENLEPDLYEGTRRVDVAGYTTDLFTDRAVEILGRQRDRPLFLSLQYNAPHWPWQAPGDPVYPDSLRWKAGGSAETYARMVQSLDQGVGRVLAAVNAAGRERATLVIFTSDNGGEAWSDMGPLSDAKMTLWEGGIRVSAMARWPGVIPAGTTSEQVAITMDWTVTLLAAGGATPDPSLPPDGIDIMPQLRGAAPISRDLFWRVTQRRQQKALRSGDWKYLVTEDAGRLFDLSIDPSEHGDLRGERPDVFTRLETMHEAWEGEVLEPVPLEGRYR